MRSVVVLMVAAFVISLISPALGAVLAGTGTCVAIVGLVMLWLASRDE
jgi:hypothetical protein